MTLDHLLPILLLAVAVILGVSRAFGYLAGRLGQPLVVGEMIAGIALGPSLLGLLSEAMVRNGWLSFHLGQAIFPPQSVIYLGVLAQLGVIFFLFLVGLELDPKLLRNKGHAAVVISHASIVVPFMLGAGLALFLYPRLFNDTPAMRFTPVALFMGAAMSITAFPVLARILTERNLHKTKIGAVAITCAAVDDVTAWCMLAFVVGVARAEGLAPALWTAGLSTVYVLGMFFVVRPFLARLQKVHDRQGRLNAGAVALVLGLVLVSAWTTERIGIHALFGAFLMGAMMPKGTQFVRTLTEKLEDFVVVLLLPIFFAYTGLKTQIGLLNTWELWGYTGLIVLVACAGKFGGSALAGRACGMGWRESSVVGVLMNTRGLMELVILNIGLSLGVITPAVFAMMVIMALVTTTMTAPILHWLYPLRMYAAEVGAALAGATARGRRKRSTVPSVLIPVADPRSGGPLLRLADFFTAAAARPATPTPAAAATGAVAERQARLGLAAVPPPPDRKIYALHLRRPVEREAYQEGREGGGSPLPAATTSAEVSLQPLLEYADQNDVPVETIAFVARRVADDIVRTAIDRDVDLLLMGAHRAVLGGSVLGGTVYKVLSDVPADVAILLDRGLGDIRRVLVPFLGSPHDRLALDLASRLGRAARARVTVLHVVADGEKNGERPTGDGGVGIGGVGVGATAGAGAGAAVSRAFNDPAAGEVEFRVVRGAEPVDAVLAESDGFDLLIVGVGAEWGLGSQFFGLRPERLAAEARCSLLLVRKGERREGDEGTSSDAPAAEPVAVAT